MILLMVTTQKPRRPRPYWYIDAKWVAGLLLFSSLSACLLLYNLSALTERDKAVPISATIVATLFSPKGLDDASGLKKFRKQVASMPGTTVAPIKQFPSITISKHDALTLGPADLKIALFSQITGPIYDLGLKTAAKQLTPKPADQQEFVSQAQLLGILTKQTHTLLQVLFLGAAIASVVFTALLVFFSAGWGRLASPGIVLLAISPVATLASLFLLHPPTNGYTAGIAMPRNIAEDIGGTLSQSYGYATLLGILLLGTAFAGKVVSALMRQSQKATDFADKVSE